MASRIYDSVLLINQQAYIALCSKCSEFLVRLCVLRACASSMFCINYFDEQVLYSNSTYMYVVEARKLGVGQRLGAREGLADVIT